MLGRVVDHYRITGQLGTGGMGVVYEAEDTRLPRRVALKFLADEVANDPDASRRFRREARMIALLNHPQICTIYDIGSHEGRAFIAMERVDGVTLKTYMARKTLSTPDIVDIALQVTRALEAAHAQGIVHRDIKPGNVMVSEAGQVKVLDFGLARRFQGVGTAAAEGAGLDGSTILGRPLGTANYMAPERILQMPVDPRSDLFSLGVVIYEMATARLPFAGASPGETVTNVLDSEPEPLTRLAPSRPKELDRIVMRLLAKRASERFQTSSALADALEALGTPGRRGLRQQLRERIRGGRA